MECNLQTSCIDININKIVIEIYLRQRTTSTRENHQQDERPRKAHSLHPRYGPCQNLLDTIDCETTTCSYRPRKRKSQPSALYIRSRTQRPRSRRRSRLYIIHLEGRALVPEFLQNWCQQCAADIQISTYSARQSFRQRCIPGIDTRGMADCTAKSAGHVTPTSIWIDLFGVWRVDALAGHVHYAHYSRSVSDSGAGQEGFEQG